MPKKHYIVVILDVNSIPRESPINNVVTDHQNEETGEKGSNNDDNAEEKNGQKTVPPPSPIPYNYEMIKSIKEMVLTLLAKEALQYHTEKFDFSQVFWSIKLYNSSVEINSKTGRCFQPIGLESIEAFEKQLESFLDMSSQSAIKSDPNINQIQFLSTSLKSVLGDLHWPEPSTGHDELSGNDNRNVIHAMFRVPGNEAEVEDFIPNWTPTAGSKAIMNELLPKAFCRKLKEYQIQLHFMDLWPAFKKDSNNGSRSIGGDEKYHSWETEGLSRPMMKIAHYLGGKVSPFTQISVGVPLGMPSYADLLKQLLLVEKLQNSIVPSDSLLLNNSARSKTALDDSQKTIRKLQGSMNGGSLVNKTFPDDNTDGDSIRSNANNNNTGGGHRIPIPTPSYALAKHQRRSCPEMVQQNDRRWARPSDSGGGDVIRRYSDEREEHLQPHRRQTISTSIRMPQPINQHHHHHHQQHEDVPKKRKYEFEDDMESEEGYSPTDIENWCMGKAAIKEKHHHNNNRAVGGTGRDKSFNNSFGSQPKHAPVSKYVSPQLTQPQKRIRRGEIQREEEIMAPPSLRHPSSSHHRHSNNATNNATSSSTNNKYRYSDPITSSTSYNNKPTTNNRNRAESQQQQDYLARGRVMVHEGLKKKNNTKHKQQHAHSQEQELVRMHQTNFWKENEKIMNSYKDRFLLLTKAARATGRDEDPTDDLATRAKWFTEMVIREDDCCLPSTAQAMVTTVGAALVDLQVRDLRAIMEKILFIPYEKLNLEVIRLKNTEDEDAVFRKCFLQIFINFEMVWTVPMKNMAALEEQFIEDVTRILGLVRVYRRKPPIEDFVNEVLVPLYNPTHGRLLREITETMNIRPSAMLNTSFDSPRSGSGSGRDDCSVSSFSSSMCGPDDSTSQHPNDNSFSQQSQLNQSQHSVRTSLRTASFLSVNNPKRALMLPVSKLPTKANKIYQKSQSQSTQSGSLRPTTTATKSPKPKKVRRNLFDVKASRDPKDMKTLLNLATSNTSSFSRSPSLFLKSPSNKLSGSPRSPAGGGRPSPFFVAARAARAAAMGKSGGVRSSRRRLIMDPEDVSPHNNHQRPPSGVWGTISESPNESLLCPESPLTPHFKASLGRNSCSNNKDTPGSKHSSGKSIVHESPESVKPKPSSGNNRSGGLYRNFNRRIDSVSFYSSGNDSLKARAWERSGAKLMAARIRDSVDLSQSLSLNDLEFTDSNNELEEKEEECCSNNGTRAESPVACCSNTLKSNNGVVTSLEGINSSTSNSIRALFSEEIMSTPTEILNAIGTTITTIPAPIGLDTPSKRVQFSLVHTPSPTNRSSHCGTPVTPKSILKDAGNTHTTT